MIWYLVYDTRDPMSYVICILYRYIQLCHVCTPYDHSSYVHTVDFAVSSFAALMKTVHRRIRNQESGMEDTSRPRTGDIM